MIYTFTLQKLKKEDEIKLKVSKRKEIVSVHISVLLNT